VTPTVLERDSLGWNRPIEGDGKRIRLLTFSTLYPSSNRPTHGIFVETRLRHLLASGEVESRVIAPVPWFPSAHPRFGDYAKFSAVPKSEVHNGIAVEHPRYLLLPKVGMTSAPFTLARTALVAARKLIASGYDFDAIDAHYFYPDGVAAVMVGEALGKPVLITARGTDISLIPRYALPRRMILNAARKCAAMVTVCAALKDALVALGADPEKISVLRNGVDLELFSPQERSFARAAYGVSRYCLVSVGHLVERKGHDLVIAALPELPDAELLIAGTGPEEPRLRALAASMGLTDRVSFLGSLPQKQLCTLYSAADVLVLASSREGWPNVLLEAMACGTPVVAAPVWGTPEVVAAPEAGMLMRERSAAGIAEGVKRLRNAGLNRLATRCYAEKFSWDATTRGQIELLAGMF
jgi:teichuronic acid biosynthesis glycosyltransferase TuaC